ncbi:MAG: hypothetical protein OEL88_05155 [Sterolibacteriaceae bacterium MAG5]|nr:hypothetical protein [Candidatus Nitricoxidireducens bremensis]
MDRRLKSWPQPVAALLATAMSLAAAAEAVPDAAVVRFNAICATCHEGECSGRLSFDSGAAAARNHVERHAGPSDASLLRQLYAILRHTKENCHQYPLTNPPQARSEWTAEDIAPWRDTHFGTYFIPLGELGTGQRRLEFEFDGPATGSARLADERMDTAAEERFSRGSEPAMVLTAVAGMRYYLHLQTEAVLQQLRIR